MQRKISCFFVLFFMIGVLGACKSSYNSQNDAKRSKAVEAITDERLLATIAIYDRNYNIKIQAAKKVVSSKMAYIIASTASAGNDVKYIAINNINNEALLLKIISHSYDLDVIGWAMYRLQSFYAYIAINYNNAMVRKKAVEKIYDNDLLLRVAVTSTDENISKYAVENLFSELYLNECIQNAKLPIIRSLAQLQLHRCDDPQPLLEKNQRLLMYLAVLFSPELSSAGDALFRITDNNLLMYYATNQFFSSPYKNKFVRYSINSPQNMLIALANTNDTNIRKVALLKLALIEVARYKSLNNFKIMTKTDVLSADYTCKEDVKGEALHIFLSWDDATNFDGRHTYSIYWECDFPGRILNADFREANITISESLDGFLEEVGISAKDYPVSNGYVKQVFTIYPLESVINEYVDWQGLQTVLDSSSYDMWEYKWQGINQ